MQNGLRAALWSLALVSIVFAASSLIVAANRPPPGTAVAAPTAAEPELTPQTLPANKPATNPLPAAAGTNAGPPPPAYVTTRTDPGNEFYRSGNYDKAIAYWTEMAKQGDMEANYRLGQEYMYAKSGVVSRDLVKARKYYLAAANLGDPRSMFDMGTIYEYGLGVPADLGRAGTWYKLAADYGHPQGQYNYATMLEEGQGAPKDVVLAYMYYRLAAQQGFYGVPYDVKKQRPDSSQPVPLQSLEKQLTPAQIKDAEAKLAAFKPRSGPLDPQVQD